MMRDMDGPAPEELAFVRELKRFQPLAPSPELKMRTFGDGRRELLGELAWAAALFLFLLGLAASSHPGRSQIPARIILKDARIDAHTPRSVAERLKEHYLNLAGGKDG